MSEGVRSRVRRFPETRDSVLPDTAEQSGERDVGDKNNTVRIVRNATENRRRATFVGDGRAPRVVRGGPAGGGGPPGNPVLRRRFRQDALRDGPSGTRTVGSWIRHQQVSGPVSGRPSFPGREGDGRDVEFPHLPGGVHRNADDGPVDVRPHEQILQRARRERRQSGRTLRRGGVSHRLAGSRFRQDVREQGGPRSVQRRRRLDAELVRLQPPTVRTCLQGI